MIRKADQRNRVVFYRNVHIKTCNMLLDQSLNKMNSLTELSILSLNFQDSRKFCFPPAPIFNWCSVLNQVDSVRSIVAQVENHFFTGVSSCV